MKEKHAHLALLVLGGIITLYLLLHESGSGVAVTSSAATPDQMGAYPNSHPLNLGDVNIGGSPLSLTYNYGPALPTVTVGASGASGACDGCGGATCDAQGIPVGTNQVPPEVIAGAVDNLASFAAKGTVG